MSENVQQGNPQASEARAVVRLRNRYGLHMRPAKQVVEAANSFNADISLLANGAEVDAKSILQIIGLGAECGDEIAIEARGADAGEAVQKLKDLLYSLPELHGEAVDIDEEEAGGGR